MWLVVRLGSKMEVVKLVEESLIPNDGPRIKNKKREKRKKKKKEKEKEKKRNRRKIVKN